ncbi:uncharacterized protein K460DRAFT_38780 [Cucurbitaria berberidis CBS 394.84]|uniref:Stc1 domain-containing protein n=1 Tax=Cucurbitaria berberidis CBS 394.84 TaxID=1168544 RepID=A0A9P4GRZ8_9PLEO|nr:uncharacterized protein K460DRAFT_38780 [Cucurbitaria berberidis CBS 394.84]KAF1851643.1 hypothetical protein K460DRAFT_38780 [Cucurbitaria berberidis CBS 394.84]
MGGRRNMHTYNQEEIDRLQGIPLPEKIRCGRCLKNLNSQAKYSVKQLTEARAQIKNFGRMNKAINCRKCMGEKATEIECTVCNKTKGLEEFANSQRNKPDTARCFKCTDERVSQEAINDEKYKDPKNAFVTPDHSGGNYPEYFSSATSTTDSSSTYGDKSWNSVNGDHDNGSIALTQGLQAMSVSGSSNETAANSGYTYPSARDFKSGDDGNWTEVRTKSWHTESTGPASTSSGFNSNRYGKAPATSTTGPALTLVSGGAERSETSESRHNGWAKKSDIPRGSYNMGVSLVSCNTHRDCPILDI